MRPLLLCALLLAALAGCELITGPRLPENAVRFDPPTVYTEWWRMTEQCSALGGDLSRIAWYVVPEASVTSADGDEVQGLYLYGDRIVLSQSSMYSGPVVRHEMLHAMLKGKGHPRADFVGRCGGVVACSVRCIGEGTAPSPPRGALTVAPSELAISVSVWPETPGIDVLDGYVRVTVTARNPRAGPVVVSLPSYPGYVVGFGTRITQGPWATVREFPVMAQETRWFAAGETKRFVFEFWANPGAPPPARLTTGTYSVTGAFGNRWGTSVPLTIH